jgi:hypothetical protein
MLALMALALAGCGIFGGDDDGSGETSVFSVKPGECFKSQDDIKAQISDLDRVECTARHGMESYAVIGFRAPEGVTIDDYPGDDTLNKFAEGACAQAFGKYVGVTYLDSSLYYTYLVPSARSWDDDDRSVVCFVVGSGDPLQGSAKGSKL